MENPDVGLGWIQLWALGQLLTYRYPFSGEARIYKLFLGTSHFDIS
jgi:hypothetical protein